MKVAFLLTLILAVVLTGGITATAHHSNPLYFQMDKAITLEGKVLRMEWVNPHILLYLQSKNEKGELETWVLQGSSLVTNPTRWDGLKPRLLPGITITARVHPPRNPLYVNDKETVLLTRPDDPKTSPRIVGVGEIRLPNGEVHVLGGGPKF
jgi:hypothetical protein